MKRTPPDILITTPESLYLLLTSQVREILTGVEAVIVDEIHAVAQSKRGAHLALSLERLSHLVRTSVDGGTPGGEAEEVAARDVQRIGLSATQRPLERIAQFLVGPKRKCEIVNAGVRKDLDLQIVVPVEDMTEPGADPSGERRAASDGQVMPDLSPDRIDPGARTSTGRVTGRLSMPVSLALLYGFGRTWATFTDRTRPSFSTASATHAR